MAGKLYNASAGLNKAHTLMLIITAAYPEHQAEDPRIDLGRVDLYIFKQLRWGHRQKNTTLAVRATGAAASDQHACACGRAPRTVRYPPPPARSIVL